MKAKIADSKRLNIFGNGDLSSNREILNLQNNQFDVVQFGLATLPIAHLREKIIASVLQVNSRQISIKPSQYLSFV